MTSSSYSTIQPNSSDSTSDVSPMPYGVSLVLEIFPLTFYYKAFNVPDSVSINNYSISSVTVLFQN